MVGTRPEAIKLAPVIRYFKGKEDDVCVVSTGQHSDLLYPILKAFSISPDVDFKAIQFASNVGELSSFILAESFKFFSTNNFDLVFVHGDTISSTSAAFGAFLAKVPVGHIEAGLRTFDLSAPWPEEANRQLTARLASYHFAPTLLSKDNLIKENIPRNSIIVTGNTVVDAIRLMRDDLEDTPALRKSVIENICAAGLTSSQINSRYILVTCHRRENFGLGFENICMALKTISTLHPNINIIFPVHLNPSILEAAKQHLSDLDNVFLIAPQSYPEFVFLMKESMFILTDSGGIQEEASSLGKLTLVLRDATERPEALDSGLIELVGTNKDRIVKRCIELISLQGPDGNEVIDCVNPYGDGFASEKIYDFLHKKIRQHVE